MNEMLSYEQFCQKVKDEIADYLDFVPNNISLVDVNKVNYSYVALCIEDGSNIAVPNINLENAYGAYCDGLDFNEVLKGVAYTYDKALSEHNEFFEKQDKIKADITSKEYILENVYLTLGNNIQNAEYFFERPEYKIEGMKDVSGIYRVLVDRTDEGISSFSISKSQMEVLGITKDELDSCVIENTRRLFPSLISTMSERMAELGGALIEDSVPMYVITNTSGLNGATVVLYDKEMDEFARRVVGDDLILLPSSVLEFLAIPKSVAGDDYVMNFVNMVNEVNMSVLTIDERLSNNIYVYDMNERKISQVSNVNKNLDGESMTFIVGKSI
jgi:hypothetical protein